MRFKTSFFAALAIAAPLHLLASVPHIGTAGDPPNPTIIATDNFGFGADNLGGGLLTFQNETGHDWRDLDVKVSLFEETPIYCSPGPFLSCTITPYFPNQATSSTAITYDILFGPSRGVAVANGSIFSVNLNDEGTDPSGVGSWGAGTDFDARANITPEPAAGALAAAGVLMLAGVAVYRRRATVR